MLLVPESPMQERGGSPRSSFLHRSCIVVFSWSEVGSLAIEETGSCRDVYLFTSEDVHTALDVVVQ